MKSFLAVALLVGLAISNPTAYYGWTPNQELTYHFETEHLVGIPGIKPQFGAVKLTSKVLVQTFPDYSLRIKFTEPKFIVVNGELSHGPDGRPEVPKAEQSVPGEIKQHLIKPFVVHHKAGVVESLFVESNEPVTVVNIKKAFVSQIQMDLAGIRRNEIPSNGEQQWGSGHTVRPQPPQEQQNPEKMSYFTTEETTLTGDCQTSYTVHELPQYQGKDIEEGMKSDVDQLKREHGVEHPTSGQGERICEGKKYFEILKVKSYDNCKQRPVYQSNMGIKSYCDPSKSTCKDIMTHSSSTSYIVCGESLHQFYIRKIISVGSAVTNPLGWNNTPEKMTSDGKLGLWLLKIRSSGFSPLPEPSDRKEKRSLIFEFPIGGPLSHIGTSDVAANEEYRPILPMPDMTSQPKLVFPFTINGEEMKRQVISQFEKIVQEIYKSPESCSSRSDIAGSVSVISQGLRSLSLQQLKSVDEEIKSRFGSGQQRQIAKDLFNDVLSMIGSNPSVALLKEKIQRNEVGHGTAGLNVIQNTMRNVKTPTRELLKTLLEMVKLYEQGSFSSSSSSVPKKQVYNSGLISFSNLLYRACVHPETSVNDFPVRVFGRFCRPDSGIITERFIPYLTEKLTSGQFERSEKLIFISAMGKLGHKDTLKPLSKVIEGQIGQGPRRQGDEEPHPLPRSLAVYSLKRLAKREPSLVRPVLNALITNPAERPEVRIAAVSVLPWTQPTTADLQKMAVRTWFEPSKQVASFIYSTLKSLPESQIPELKPVGLKAQTLLSLIKPFEFGYQYSQHVQSNNFVQYLRTASSVEGSYVPNEEGLVPGRARFDTKLYGGSWELQGISFTTYTQGMDALLDQVFVSLGYKSRSSEKVRQQLEKITRDLGILGRGQSTGPKEMLFQMKMLDMELMFSSDERSYTKVLEYFAEEIGRSLASGGSESFRKVHALNGINIDVLGPSESGFPVYIQRNVPVVLGIKGEVSGSIRDQNIRAKLIPVINGKMQSNYGILCPFTQKFVGAGVEMSLHMSTPIELVGNAERGALQLKAKIPEEIRHKFELIHIYVKPYTVSKSLDRLSPIGKSSSVKPILVSEHGQTNKHVYPIGRSVGIDAEIEVDTDMKNIGWGQYLNQLRQHNVGSFLANAMMTSTSRYTSLKLELNPESSSTKEIQTSIALLWGNKTFGSDQIYPTMSTSTEGSIRSFCFEKHASSVSKAEECVRDELKSVEAHNEGVQKLKASLGKLGGLGSVVQGVSVHNMIKMRGGNSKSLKTVVVGGTEKRGQGEYKTIVELQFKSPSSPSYEIELETVSKLPQIPVKWNLQQLINSQIKMEFDGQINYGHPTQGQKKTIRFSTEWEKTDKLRESIRESLELRKCQQQISSGQSMASVCEETRHQASSVDQVKGKLVLPESLLRPGSPSYNLWTKIETGIKGYFFSNMYIDQEYNPRQSGPYKFEWMARVNRTGGRAYASITNPWEKFELKNIRVPGPLSGFMPLSLRNGVELRLLQDISRDQHPASCRLDKQQISSFDNRTYEYGINDCEHLVFKDCARQGESVRPVAVTSKNVGGDKKEVKFLTGMDIIKMKPQGGRGVEITINGRQIDLPVGQIYREHCPVTGYETLRARRYQDNVVTIFNPIEQVEVIFDGERLEVVAPQMLRHRSCGLCGDLNGENTADLKTPKKCVMSKPKFSGYSYMLPRGSGPSGSSCSGVPSQDQERYQQEKSQCVKQRQIPTQLEGLVRQLVHGGRRNGLPNGVKPVGKVHFFEKQRNQICISKKMVRVCPDSSKPMKVQPESLRFVCMSKHTSKGEQLLKLAKSGQNIKLELNSLPVSYVKRVFEPVVCGPSSGRFTTGSGSPPYTTFRSTGEWGEEDITFRPITERSNWY